MLIITSYHSYVIRYSQEYLQLNTECVKQAVVGVCNRTGGVWYISKLVNFGVLITNETDGKFFQKRHLPHKIACKIVLSNFTTHYIVTTNESPITTHCRNAVQGTLFQELWAPDQSGYQINFRTPYFYCTYCTNIIRRNYKYSFWSLHEG